MKVTLYHNPRCSKSRQTLELLRLRGIEPEIIEYLKDPPDAAELRRLLKALGIRADGLLRKGEAEYQELKLGDDRVTDEQRIDAMVRFPRLIERPIVVCGTQARLGRPPERVLEIIPA
jgi:arsenate reductase